MLQWEVEWQVWGYNLPRGIEIAGGEYWLLKTYIETSRNITTV